MATYNNELSAQKNNVLCRKDLDSITSGNYLISDYGRPMQIEFLKINGITDFWKRKQNVDSGSLVGDVLNSCIKYNRPFVYVIIGDEDGISVYIGTLDSVSDSLRASYESNFPGIDMDYVEGNPLSAAPCRFGGMFTGIPTNKTGTDNFGLQIENICRGMQGKQFTYAVLASGLSSYAVTLGHDRILEEMAEVFPMINQTVSGGAQGNLSAQKQDFYSKNYFENLETLEQIFKTGEARGMWSVNGYYASDNRFDAQQLEKIIRGSFSGEASVPEQFRVFEYDGIGELIRDIRFVSERMPASRLHPLGSWERLIVRRQGELQTTESELIELYVYKYQTILHSDQLATLCQLPSKEFPGFYVDDYVEFDVSNRVRGNLDHPVSIGDICVAGRKSPIVFNNPYLVEQNDLTRHALIIGITGGGKTNTSKSILNTLWNRNKLYERIPFLVIESAKREYWELRNLKGFEDLLVFTLGAEASETSVKYRINPFEACSGISLQTHIDYLLSAFKAAFDLQPPLPYILETAVYEIYSDRGWDIVENKNRYGLTEYPTLTDLYDKVDILVDRMGYHKEVQSNVKAALKTRIHSLMIGGKGAMLNTPKSVPIGELLNRPVVMELEDLGDDETKSFVIGILLVQLYEYRKTQMTRGSRELSHILMVEEAHRLLKNVSGTNGSGTQAKSIEFFCNLLAEIRTFGQGIVIADQIPTKLASDTIKNTNLKIVHRTVAQDDRETIGKAMNMSQEQTEYLSSLRRGYAAVYAEGDSRPKYVKIPLLESEYSMERNEVLTEVRQKLDDVTGGYDKQETHHAACAFCERRCEYFKRVSQFVDNRLNRNNMAEKMRIMKFSPSTMDTFFNVECVSEYLFENDFERRCMLGYVLEGLSELEDSQSKQVFVEYLKYKYSE